MNFSTISVVTGCFMVLVSSFLPGKEKAPAMPQNFDQNGLSCVWRTRLPLRSRLPSSKQGRGGEVGCPPATFSAAQAIAINLAWWLLSQLAWILRVSFQDFSPHYQVSSAHQAAGQAFGFIFHSFRFCSPVTRRLF